MIEAASFIGFALVFIAVAAGSSLALGGVTLLLRNRLRCLGPRAERAAAACALFGPPLFAAVLTLAVVGHSLSLRANDHCFHHTHHLHLCLYHGGAWSTVLWAVITVASAGALFAVRAGERALGLWRSQAALRLVTQTTRRAGTYGTIDVLLAPASSAFCFVAGFRPKIFVSTAAWQELNTLEREALLAHEAAHVAGGDLRRRCLLGGLALFGLPGVSTRLLALWDESTERLCDRLAANTTGTPTSVAGALVKLARLGVPARINLVASFMTPGDLTDRVQTVLRGGHEGTAAATWFSFALASLIVGTGIVSAVWSDWLHHTIETLLTLV